VNMPTKQTPNLHRDQGGFASIVIALILIVVLALITVGFAQLARREQQNALDKQLASQAYYSAESGVNDTQQIVQNAFSNPAAIPSLHDLTPISAGGPEDPNKCLTNQSPSIPGLINGTVGSTGASYSCVLLDIAPPNLVWSSVSPDSDRNVTFSTTGALNSLTVFWGSSDNATTFKPAVSGFTPVGGAWGGSPAVLEFSLTPLPAPPGVLDRTAMINNTFTVFLYPSTGDGSVDYDITNQGQVKGGQCNLGPDPANPNQYPCSVAINRIPGSANEQYLIHIINYYDPSNISVGKAVDAGGAKLDFNDGQAVIDVTGKARTVLKRIQVRAPIKAMSPLPPYALQGQNVCKRFYTYPGTLTPDTLSPSCSLN